MIKDDTVSAGFKEKLLSFTTLIDELSVKDYKDSASMIKDILNATGYLEEIEEDRIQNVLEFLSSAEKMPVRDFLDKIALFSNVDTWESNKNYVSLLTLHAAKGLEFPIVAIYKYECFLRNSQIVILLMINLDLPSNTILIQN